MGIGMFGMMALWLLVPAALIWLAVAGARRTNSERSAGPLQILEERFARGEIEEEEFRAKRLSIHAGS